MQNTSESTLPPNPGRSIGARITVIALVVAACTVGGGFWMAQMFHLQGNGDTPALPTPNNGVPDPISLFADWPRDRKPDAVLVLSAEMRGYLQPCGCSRPQLGGLERRYNLVQQLRAQGWPVVAADLGDLASRKGLHEQALLKYAVSMQALEKIGYTAVGLGKQEFSMPLLNALSMYTLQNLDASPRVLAANLNDRDKNFPGDGKRKSMVGDWEVVQPANGLRVGIAATVGGKLSHDVATIIDQQLSFANNAQVLSDLTQAMGDKTDLRVLLYQGTLREATLVADKFPAFQVILCQTEEEEPPASPVWVPADKSAPNRRLIVRVGHKGRYVGVVGVYKTGLANSPYQFFYKLVPLGEEFETEPGEEANQPVLQLFENYARTLKEQDFMSKYPQVPHVNQQAHPKLNVRFVGTDTCRSCHQAEYQVWADSKHSHAYEALEKKASKPGLRNYDGECIVCHTVGFGFKTGYRDEKSTPYLKNVGCESCHGPGSLHVEQPMNKEWLAMLSPWKSKPDDRLPAPDLLLKAAAAASIPNSKPILTPDQKLLVDRVDRVCQKCHDPDNDPHFHLEDKKYWPKIVHSGLTPRFRP